MLPRIACAVHLPRGCHPEGVLVNPEGVLVNPEGVLVYPEGVLVYPEGVTLRVCLSQASGPGAIDYLYDRVTWRSLLNVLISPGPSTNTTPCYILLSYTYILYLVH